MAELAYTRRIPVVAERDVIVVGAGSAGMVAAVTASRLGCRVTLVERYGFLGGTSTQVLDTFYGFFTPGAEAKRVVGGVPWEVANRLLEQRSAISRPNSYGAGTGITYNPQALKGVWDELAQGAGVELRLHTFCTDVVAGGDGHTLIADGKRGLVALKAPVIVDASGDADVAAALGAPVEVATASGQVQSATCVFTLCNVDDARARGVKRAELEGLMREANASGRYQLPREEGSIHPTPIPGVWVANMTRVAGVDGTDPESLSRAELEGRRQALEYVRFLIDRVPGYERAALVSLSTQIGIRESRRLIGRYRLNAEDVLSARKFADPIAQCGAPIEDHHAGRDTKWRYLPEGETVDIPLRALLPQDTPGLIVAGRCLSATHDAHAAVRSMAQCMAMGQAAGTAAALAVQTDTEVGELDPASVRERLAADGALLGGAAGETAGGCCAHE